MSEIGIWREVYKERNRQNKLHPNFPSSTQSKFEILKEEIDEVYEAEKSEDLENLREELIQTLAVCHRWLEHLLGDGDLDFSRICKKCNKEYSIGEFDPYIERKGPDNHKIRIRWKCTYCKREEELEYKKNNYDFTLNRVKCLKNKYGIYLDEYKEMLESQGGVCAICKGSQLDHNQYGEFYSLCVDHDHKTSKNRGLLCSGCNKGLGFFRDNSNYLRMAADYLDCS